MAYSRRLGVIGILGVCLFVAVGCDDDGDKTTNEAEAGEGGESSGAGKGGKSTGGSSNNAGKGGTTAGSSTAGNLNGGGEGGAAGEGGGAGPVGGMAGEGGTSVPMGGDGGTGAGGEPAGGGAGGAPAASAPKCSYACEIEADCQLADAAPLQCDEVTKRCVDPRQVCDADVDCVPYLSNWGSACVADTECFEGSELCVEWQGAGVCASLVDVNNPEFPCVFGVADSLPRFGAEGDADVCVAPDPRCFDGQCAPGCGDFLSGGCGIGTGDTCSETTGLCECSQGTECDTGVCGTDGHCACVDSEDCTVPGRDVCQNGICVCGSADSCPDQGFSNATAVCE
jgi:hypothetical protein